MIFTKKNMFFILFIAVFVACCVFSNKVFADESTNWSFADDLQLSGNGSIISQSGRHLPYLLLEDNKIYTISNNSTEVLQLYLFDNSPNVGEVGTFYTRVSIGSSVEIIGNSRYTVTWNYQDSSSFENSHPITWRYVNNQDNTINSLTEAISLDNLWGQFGVGLIALAVLFALGFLVVRKVLKKDSNYKG